MAKEAPKVIDYQNVEYVQPVQQTNPGIAQPRIDARVQTNNRYLDSIICSDNDRSFASSSTPTIIPSFTYDKK